TDLNHLDHFSWIGSFGGAIASPSGAAFPNLTSESHSKINFLWIACATGDPALTVNRPFKNWLQTKSLYVTDVETAGGHTYLVFRRNLNEFVQLLFKSTR